MLRPGGRVIRLWLLTAVLPLVLAACASGGQSAAGGGGGDGEGIRFTAPEDGAEAGSPVAFTLDSGGREIGEPGSGNMHFHVYVDDSSDYEIVYATEGELDVPEGQHTLRAVLAEPNHDETDVTTEVGVNVTAGGAPADEQKDDQGGGYDY